MRPLILTAILALFPNSLTVAQNVFDYWMVFPGPNPSVTDLVPDGDPETVFRIGQMIFEYSVDDYSNVENPMTDLSDLPPVADVVKLAAADPSLDALVQQQLSIPHRFEFEQAAVVDVGDAGFRWQVTHTLFPKQGATTGVPFRYVTLLDARGKIIPPRITVFDAFFHSRTEGWSVSSIRLPRTQPVSDASLTESAICDRATKQFETLSAGRADSPANRMQFRNQELVRIPISTDSTGGIIYSELWAINFADPERKDRADEAFTVWVAADGRVAELRHFDVDLNADEQSVAPKPPVKR